MQRLRRVPSRPHPIRPRRTRRPRHRCRSRPATTRPWRRCRLPAAHTMTRRSRIRRGARGMSGRGGRPHRPRRTERPRRRGHRSHPRPRSRRRHRSRVAADALTRLRKTPRSHHPRAILSACCPGSARVRGTCRGSPEGAGPSRAGPFLVVTVDTVVASFAATIADSRACGGLHAVSAKHGAIGSPRRRPALHHRVHRYPPRACTAWPADRRPGIETEAQAETVR